MIPSTDLDEAAALGHYYDIIEIYSNSWGPSDNGFTVSGPGTLLQRTYEVGVREVHSKLLLLPVPHWNYGVDMFICCCNYDTFSCLIFAIFTHCTYNLHAADLIFSVLFRVDKAEVPYTCGQLEMVDDMVIPVQLMAMLPVSIQYPLGQQLPMAPKVTTMSNVREKWQ